MKYKKKAQFLFAGLFLIYAVNEVYRLIKHM